MTHRNTVMPGRIVSQISLFLFFVLSASVGRAGNAETPFDRFKQLKEVEVRVNVTYEMLTEWSKHEQFDGSEEQNFATGYRHSDYKNSAHFESEWRGVLRFKESNINDDGDRELTFAGDMEADVSGLFTHRDTPDVTLLDTTEVTLTVTDSTDMDSVTRTVYVLARPPE